MTLNSIVFWGGGGHESGDQFIVKFYEDGEDQPDAGNFAQADLLSVDETYAGENPGTQEVWYQYTAIFASGITLQSGETYWVSVAMNGAQWFWLSGSGGDGHALSQEGEIETGWTDLGYDMAFELYSEGPAPVPEPSSLTLVAFGLIGLGWMLRRQINR